MKICDLCEEKVRKTITIEIWIGGKKTYEGRGCLECKKGLEKVIKELGGVKNE